LPAEGGLGVGSGSSLRQQGSKARKNCFLNWKRILHAPVKRKRNFCGLCPPSGGEPLGGIAPRSGAIIQGFVGNEF
jgi:hypothetical protein